MQQALVMVSGIERLREFTRSASPFLHATAYCNRCFQSEGFTVVWAYRLRIMKVLYRDE